MDLIALKYLPFTLVETLLWTWRLGERRQAFFNTLFYEYCMTLDQPSESGFLLFAPTLPYLPLPSVLLPINPPNSPGSWLPTSNKDIYNYTWPVQSSQIS